MDITLDNFKTNETNDNRIQDGVQADSGSENALTAEDLPDKVNVIGVTFRDSNKLYHFAANGVLAKEGDHVIVETARGVEYGKVSMANKLIPKTELVLPLKKVLRAATEEDDRHLEENAQKEEEAFSICQKKITEHGLDMKLIDVEYTFDNAKLLFYFTSDDRVDFRELVKDLAGTFRTRIELRQIGIRDETKLMGGLGVCYREYCCHSFLNDFTQVSIKMAKEQGLSLNSAKISGACGRLMCCLRFEHETYQEEIKRTPKVGALLVTPDGTGTVIESKPLVGLVKVKLDADPEGAPKIYDRDLVRLKTDADEITKKGEKVERPKLPTNVPFTPLTPIENNSGTEGTDGSAAGSDGKEGRESRPRQNTQNRRSRDNRRKNNAGSDTGTAVPAGDEPSRKNSESGTGAKNAQKSKRSQNRQTAQDGKNDRESRNEKTDRNVSNAPSRQESKTSQNAKNPGQGQGGRNVRVNNGKVDKFERPPKSERPDGDETNAKRERRDFRRRNSSERKGENTAKKNENPNEK